MKHSSSTLALFGFLGLAAGWGAPLDAAAAPPELQVTSEIDKHTSGLGSASDLEGAGGLGSASDLEGAGGLGSASELEGAGGLESAPDLEATSEPEAAACGGLRWISLQDPAAQGFCTASGGFDAEPLFPSGQQLPAQLAGYCLHTWAGQGAPSMQALAQWQSQMSATGLAEDCAFVTPLGLYEERLATMLRGAIASRIGVVSGAPHAKPLVHVAVIDTTPDASASLPVLGNNRHGDTLAALIGDVVQVPGAAAISTTLAMPLVTDPATGDAFHDPSGGDYGHLSDLARALWRAVVLHRAHHAGARLVLNLSLGWEPLDKSSACTGGMRAAARAVRAVLDVAACDDGALIVAAAGNELGGPAPGAGLTCPAVWMTEAPSCDPQRPLVIAAYGLDHADAPLAVARAGSATPFAAPGLGGVAWSGGAPVPAPLTGTSVAAAAVSASIAAAWAAAPELEGADITALLYDHATPIGAPADVCSGGLSGCDVRRISPCGALSALGSPWACAASAAPSPASNPELDPATHVAFLANLAGAAPVSVTAGAGPLPSELAPAAAGQLTVNPQPIIPMCPSCAVTLGLSGTATSNPVFYGSLSRSVTSLSLVVSGATSSSHHSVSITPATSTFRATLPLSASSARSAWISATDAVTGLSIVEQILVVQ